MTEVSDGARLADWLKILISASVAGLVAGVFGVAHDWASQDQQRCALSEQILGDESLNPALGLRNQQSLAIAAGSRLRRCLGDD
jgi:hypothetical protein